MNPGAPDGRRSGQEVGLLGQQWCLQQDAVLVAALLQTQEITDTLTFDPESDTPGQLLRLWTLKLSQTGTIGATRLQLRRLESFGIAQLLVPRVPAVACRRR